MKKSGAILLSVIFFLANAKIVSAECSSTDLTNYKAIANKVTASYTTDVEKRELREDETPPDGYNYMEESYLNQSLFNVYINNITEDIYIKVTNSLTKEEKTYTSKDAVNGVITFKDYNLSELKTYTVDIYATNAACIQKLRSLSLKLPMFNEYSAYSICFDTPEYYLCHEYINEEIDYSYDELADLIRNYRKKNEPSEEDPEDPEVKKEKKDRKIIIITAISVGAIVIIGGAAFVIIRRRK